MITIPELKKKASQKYCDFLFNYLCDSVENFFPLIIPSNKGNANDDLTKRESELREIHKYSKNNGKKSYLYETGEVNTRLNGRQTVITKILFENQVDYLTFIGKMEDFKTFSFSFNILNNNIFNDISKDYLINWAVKNHEKLSDKNVEDGCENYWKNICLCANWLHVNTESNLYIRMIPVEVHSKFIENNENIIHSLLSEEKITKANSFIKQHNLHDKPAFIRMRFLYDCEISKGFSPKEIYFTEDDFAVLDKADFMNCIKNIYIVENEMIYLTFPKVSDSVCIWGHGFTAALFKRFQWFNNYNLFYFGDLDEHGYDILSIVRGFFPGTKSISMDINTLETFNQFRVKGEVLSGNIIPANLSKDELEVFMELRKDKNKNRLEQERISQKWIEEAVYKTN